MSYLLQRLVAILAFAFISMPPAAARSAAPSELRLPHVFGDRMVLQRDIELPIWGWAAPEARISVQLRDATTTATANGDGRWAVTLPPQPVGESTTLSVSDGNTTVALRDVLLGDVWLCSGQSNMAMAVGLAQNGAAEVAAAHHSNLRLLSVGRTVAVRPRDDISTRGWQPSTPDTVTSFSAVAYFFGRDLLQETSVPVGLIHASWGGTPIESWMSEETLASLPRWRDQVAALEHPETTQPAVLTAAHAERMKAWEAIVDERDPGNAGATWAASDFNDDAWSTMTLPGSWDKRDLPTYDGTVWFRRSVIIPENLVGQKLRVILSDADDDDRTYVNGQLIGSTRGFGKVRRYDVPDGLFHPGKNQITVRILDLAAGGGITGDPTYLRVDATDSSGTVTVIPLAGVWKWHRGIELTEVPPRPIAANSAMRLAGLYNGMIHPIAPFGLKGVIWYQGESNAPRAAQYRTLFPAMISNWRAAWRRPELPFIFVQLPEFLPAEADPVDSSWAELREAQAMALRLPHTGMAITLGLGNPADIHPTNKQDVAKRLLRAACSVAYSEDVIPTGPLYEEGSMKITGNTVTIAFTNAGNGLRARGGTLKGFAIAGADHIFHWADQAQIVGSDKVTLSSSKVPHPIAVRYGWHGNPAATLENSEALPAGPFRTDNWPGVTDRF